MIRVKLSSRTTFFTTSSVFGRNFDSPVTPPPQTGDGDGDAGFYGPGDAASQILDAADLARYLAVGGKPDDGIRRMVQLARDSGILGE